MSIPASLKQLLKSASSSVTPSSSKTGSMHLGASSFLTDMQKTALMPMLPTSWPVSRAPALPAELPGEQPPPVEPPPGEGFDLMKHIQDLGHQAGAHLQGAGDSIMSGLQGAGNWAGENWPLLAGGAALGGGLGGLGYLATRGNKRDEEKESGYLIDHDRLFSELQKMALEGDMPQPRPPKPLDEVLPGHPSPGGGGFGLDPEFGAGRPFRRSEGLDDPNSTQAAGFGTEGFVGMTPRQHWFPQDASPPAEPPPDAPPPGEGLGLLQRIKDLGHQAGAHLHGAGDSIMSGLHGAGNWAGGNWPLLAGGAALGAGAGGLGYLLSHKKKDKEKKSGHLINRNRLFSELQKIAAEEKAKSTAAGRMDDIKADVGDLVGSSDKVGPYRADQLSMAQGLDPMIAATERNRKEHLLHYLLNPFVRGPVSEGLMRLGRRNAASQGSIPNLGYATHAADLLTGVPIGTAVSTLIGGPRRRTDAREQLAGSDIPQYQEGLGKGGAAGKPVKTVIEENKSKGSRGYPILGGIGGGLAGGLGGAGISQLVQHLTGQASAPGMTTAMMLGSGGAGAGLGTYLATRDDPELKGLGGDVGSYTARGGVGALGGGIGGGILGGIGGAGLGGGLGVLGGMGLGALLRRLGHHDAATTPDGGVRAWPVGAEVDTANPDYAGTHLIATEPGQIQVTGADPVAAFGALGGVTGAGLGGIAGAGLGGLGGGIGGTAYGIGTARDKERRDAAKVSSKKKKKKKTMTTCSAAAR